MVADKLIRRKILTSGARPPPIYLATKIVN